MISFGGEGERRGYSWERWTPPATARGLYRLEQGLWKAPWTGVARRRVSEKGEQRDLVKKERMMEFGWWPRMTGTRDLQLTDLLILRGTGAGGKGL